MPVHIVSSHVSGAAEKRRATALILFGAAIADSLDEFIPIALTMMHKAVEV